MRALAGNNK